MSVGVRDTATATTPRRAVGIVGLGIMGSAIAGNLLRAGYEVVGYDIAPGRCDDHRRAGGTVARSCRSLATHVDVVISSLPTAEAVRAAAGALGKSVRPPRIVIETSTLPIAVKLEVRDALRRRGTAVLDCPLSGTGAQARVRDLVVYGSGNRRAYHRVEPVLSAFTRAHYFVGPFGAGSKLKFIANLLVAIHNVAAAEALVLAMKAGLDPAMVLEAVGDGAGSSRMLQVRGPMMVKGNYSDAMMQLETWQKDLTIIAEFARDLGCRVPLFAASAPLYAAAIAMGHRTDDTAAVCAVLERMSNHQRN